PSSRDRVCMPMHNLPRPIFGSHDHRASQAGGGDGILSAELGLGSLNPDKVCQLRSYVARDGLSLNHLAISNLRCGVVHNGSGLLPSTYERAQGVTEGYVLSMGEPLLYGFRISFKKFTHRQIELLDQFLNVVLRSHLDPPLHLKAACSRRTVRSTAFLLPSYGPRTADAGDHRSPK